MIYFRSGYDPIQYPSHKEWDARLLMERSLAIKSPSIQYHLAGTKKVQQELADPKILEKFLGGNGEKIALISGIFTGLYTLDRNEAGNATFDRVMKNPERYFYENNHFGGW